ncbi:hypothetical protein HYPSUDRAFT_1056006 [Hypholoma sublateritium FD-334 SS-4]|uniref:Nephrocystin 3-like N-terminal domain-containing protein n=1 Tax=Hypholoma sublateritium (strain FD-334 SS-4) TaxID=945553 RepID=A0A0D2KQF6_HYPSF|nr:hypothetical protein HYPSUDRAFT_1056006 [Hypholoma sublateritium FD-334 SS-4]
MLQINWHQPSAPTSSSTFTTTTPVSYSRAHMQQAGGIFQQGPRSRFLDPGEEYVQHSYGGKIHTCYDADPDGFRHLHAHVAPAAYASQQEGDAPKCHPNTRTAVLTAIIHWMTVATMGLQWILWINGAAGAGKSAIARSVIDLCIEQGIVIVRFFFFRTDSTRNTIKPIVATLAFQLIQLIPELNSIISPKIASNPLIFHESLETQFKVLIFESLRQLHKESPFEKAMVFLLDGVDECSGDDNQANLIRTIAEFVAEKTVPLIVIFSSRAESQLKMTFNSPKIDNVLRRLPLDTDYRAADDIRLFLDDSFTEIKNTHTFRSSIDPEWPAPSLVREIVDKSSNQFIYASVVVKFISSPRLHPVQQLEIVRGLRPAGDLTPFAQLDSLYRHIFSQVHDIARVTAILALDILSGMPYNQQYICEMLGIEREDIDVALADLTSVISYAAGQITFLHASLPDFLQDQSRAQQYYIDRGVWCAQLTVTLLTKRLSYMSTLATYLGQAKCTPQLREAVYATSPAIFSWHPATWSTYIDIIQKMDFGDGGEVYRHQLDMVVRHMDKDCPQEMHRLHEHDIDGILDEIERERGPGRKTSLWVRSKIHLAKVFKKK